MDAYSNDGRHVDAMLRHFAVPEGAVWQHERQLEDGALLAEASVRDGARSEEYGNFPEPQ